MKTAQWLQRHTRDHYVQQAKKYRYCSRAAFKLLEIVAQTKLFTGVRSVLDLGAAPGSWSQVASRLVPNAKIISVDLLPMTPIPGVILLQGNLLEKSTWEDIALHTQTRKIDLMLSDISTNLSGIKAVDQANSQEIYDMLLHNAHTRLAPHGTLLCKIFNNEAGQKMRNNVATHFIQHKIIKPSASRNKSAETYLWAKTIAK